jgi:hypothetical protein
MIRPGEGIIAGSNQRFRVVDVVLFAEEDESPFVGCYRSRRPDVSHQVQFAFADIAQVRGSESPRTRRAVLPQTRSASSGFSFGPLTSLRRARYL